MSSTHFDYKFPGAPQISQGPVATPLAKEKGDEGPKLSFRQSVEALPEHDLNAIKKYLPENIRGLSTRKKLDILQAAIKDNNIEAVKVLVGCGVDVKRLLLDDCSAQGQIEILEFLLRNGADPNLSTKDHWAPPLVCCIMENDGVPKENRLACAKLLLDHGADVNWEHPITKMPVLEYVNKNKNPEVVTLLLSRGADPLALRGYAQPLRPHDFQVLGPHITDALQQGNPGQVGRWITAVARFMPDPRAASLLIEWAALCRSDPELTKNIHDAITLYLGKLEGDPPADVADYARKYNAWVEEEEALEKEWKVSDELHSIVKELEADGLKPVGMGKDFHIEGIGDYSAEKHGPILMKLAYFWAFRVEDRMDHVTGIIRFLAKTAKEQQAPQAIRKELFASVKLLWSQLAQHTDPAIAARAEAIDDFLNPFN
jgi:ankyrin repeat protein